MTKWIEYSLIWDEYGIGEQPYEVLQYYGVNFDGGYYVVDGRYRGRMTSTHDDEYPNEWDLAFTALSDYLPTQLTEDDMRNVVETLEPINSEYTTSEGTVLYVGPVTFDEELRVVREWAPTPFITN